MNVNISPRRFLVELWWTKENKSSKKTSTFVCRKFYAVYTNSKL